MVWPSRVGRTCQGFPESERAISFPPLRAGAGRAAGGATPGSIDRGSRFPCRTRLKPTIIMTKPRTTRNIAAYQGTAIRTAGVPAPRVPTAGIPAAESEPPKSHPPNSQLPGVGSPAAGVPAVSAEPAAAVSAPAAERRPDERRTHRAYAANEDQRADDEQEPADSEGGAAWNHDGPAAIVLRLPPRIVISGRWLVGRAKLEIGDWLTADTCACAALRPLRPFALYRRQGRAPPGGRAPRPSAHPKG